MVARDICFSGSHVAHQGGNLESMVTQNLSFMKLLILSSLYGFVSWLLVDETSKFQINANLPYLHKCHCESQQLCHIEQHKNRL
jgi:hypothetical protein